jgi:soluble epoxide hydrolase/lipid-phosphate phosphatase
MASTAKPPPAYLPNIGCAYTSNHVQLNTGVNIHYIKAGASHVAQAKEGKVILLIHGWPEFWYGWRNQIPALAAQGYLVLVPDMRGFGLTQILSPQARESPHSYTFKQQSQDLMALLEYEQIRSAIIIGHDWGGAVVWNCARRFCNRISAVAGICTPYRPRKSQYISPEQLAKIMPNFYYQVYFSNQREAAAKEFESDVRRTVKSIFRAAGKNEKVATIMSSGSSGFISNAPLDEKDIPLSSIMNEEQFKYYVEMYEYTGYKHSLMWYSTSKINYDEENVQEEYVPIDANNITSKTNIKIKTTVKSTKVPTYTEINSATIPRNNVDQSGLTLIVRELSPIISQPSLMVTTGRDPILKPQLSIGMEQWCLGLERAHIEQAGHWVLQEQPEKINQILLKWIKALPATPENTIPPPKNTRKYTNEHLDDVNNLSHSTEIQSKL